MNEKIKSYIIFYLVVACLALILGVYNKNMDLQTKKNEIVYNIK